MPVGHVTNGVHVPSWDSPGADKLWTAACGKERWRGVPDALPELIASLSDEQLWILAGEERQILIQQVRARLARQLGSRGYPPEIVARSTPAPPANNRAICSGCVSISKFRNEIVVGRDPEVNYAHEDVYIAIRDSFDATRRLLEDHVRQGRGDVKLHAVPDHGRIARPLPQQNCGFILSAEGNEIYFHRNSVADGAFEALVVGDEVRFVGQHSESAEGPQASTVIPLGKHHFPTTEAVCV